MGNRKRGPMSRFESKEVRVEAERERLYHFLNSAENLYELLPQDRIEDWEADSDRCAFRIKGLSSLELLREEGVPNERIDYRTGEKSPFPFTLSVHLKDDEGGTICSVVAEAELNAMMEQMVKGPLDRLFDHMAERIKELDLEN
jgi:carbon monoxide dehydrogenase subunit G